jgi:hypothetical protein
MDYLEMLKAELIAECESRELSTSGTKAELTSRLEANDNPVSEVKVKRKVFNPMTHRFEFK